MPQDFFLWENLLPRLIALAAILVVLLLHRILAKALLRLFFARLHRRNPERYRQVGIALIRPVSLMLVAGTARAVLGLFGIPAPYAAMTANIMSSIFLVMSFWVLYAAAGLMAGLLLDSSADPTKKMNANAANYMSVAIRSAVFIIGLFVLLSRWVTDISGLITGLGIGGLALALAAQDTASNLFGSIAIMLDKPFEIGDWIEVDNLMGTVISVGLRSSQIRVLDQSIVSVPNTKLAASIISNGTKRRARRVAFRIGLPFSTPPEAITVFTERVRSLLLEDPDVVRDGVLVVFDNIAASALEVFICYPTVADYTAMLVVKQRINLAILAVLKEMDLSMAYPSFSLYEENAHGK